jgi:hypothetical protein
MKKSTANQSIAKPGKGGVLLDPKHRFQPGQSGNPSGRRTAGATVREWINVLAEQGLTEDDLRRIARDRRLAWAKRTAAERMLKTLEFGDLADFMSVLKGEQDLEQLRAAGVRTEVVKKLKVKNRVDSEGEHYVEREIELHHDRAGADFDRIIGTTDGLPTKRVEQIGPFKPAHDVGELAEILVVTFGATRLPPMFQAALEQRRRAKQVDSNITSA